MKQLVVVTQRIHFIRLWGLCFEANRVPYDPLVDNTRRTASGKFII